MKQQVTLTRQAVRTPRAAAVAGIIFSVLFTTSMVLIRLALPEDLRVTDFAGWLQGQHDDDFTGAHVSAFCRDCFPVVRRRGALSFGFHGRPVLFDGVLWQRPTLSGDDVCLSSHSGRHS